MLTLAIAPFLFILVGILYEFAMVPGVYILLSPQEEETSFFLRAQMYTFSSTSLKKIQTFVWHRLTKPKLLMNWKKHKQGIQLCHGVYNETK